MKKLKIIGLIILLGFLYSCNGSKDDSDGEIRKLENELEQCNNSIKIKDLTINQYQEVLDSLNASNRDLLKALEISSVNSAIRPNVYYQDGSYLFWGPQSRYVHGIIQLEGYFLKIPENGDDNGQAICDGFVITKGPKDYIENLLKWVNDGNISNSKNNMDQVIIGIDVSDVSSSESQSIKSSSIGKEIELLILDEPIQTMVVGCFHSVKILDVE